MAAVLTRRQSMAALIAGGTAAAWYGFGVAANEGNLIRHILDRSVGSFLMNASQFDGFMSDFHHTYGGQNKAKLAGFRLFSATGAVGSRLAPMAVQDRYASFERKVITHFLTRTDFLKVKRGGETNFVADIGCTSPFARFELS